MASASSRITIVLVGKTGNGKSTTGNSILGDKLFVSKNSPSSITSVCNLQTAMVDQREIYVIDTPGLCDTQRSAESISQEISNCLYLARDGVNALVLVLSAARYTDEEIKAAESLHLIFGKEVMKYLVVVFTRGDQLDDGQTLDNYLEGAPDYLHEFLRECNESKLLFDNKTTDMAIKDSPRNHLVRVIDGMVAGNLGQPYTCEALKAAQNHALKMKKEKSKAKLEKYEQEMLKKIEEITLSNGRKNEAAIEKRLEALMKSMAETNSEIYRLNKEAFDRQLEKLRKELDNARDENMKLRLRKQSGWCTIS